MEDRDIVQCVQAVIEIGHSASLRAKPTKEGFTHDWTVFVRGQEGCDISHFVEKVVFHLHHTFSNPRRVVKVPPYCVSEAGYAGFDLPIEIYFKSRKEPRKIMFNYNLFLQMYGPVSYVRCEKLTFQKPTDEFKEKLINAGRVLVLPLGETQFADLCGLPTKTESHNKQKQPLTSKENVSKQTLNFFGNETSSNKQKNNSNDHDAASSRRSNSSSIMVSTPSPSASQKRASDSSIPNENKPKKAKISSSVSSERVRREDKQRSEHNEDKDKVVKRKDCENKDESQSKYHKKDTSKQKSSKNSKEEKKESNLKDDNISKLYDKKEAKDDKKEVRDDKKKLMDDKKEFKKDAKDDKKDGNKVQNDTKEVKDVKRKVQNDKNKVINKSEVQNDKKEVKHEQMEIKNDRKDVKDHRNGHNEVKSSKSLSKGKNDNEKLSSNRNKQSEITTDAKSEHRKRPGSPLSALDESLTKKNQDSVKHSTQVTSVELKEVLSLSSKTYNQMYSKSALKILMDELEDSSSDDDDITATVDIFCQQKSVAKISPSVEPSKASPADSCKRNPNKTYKAISENSTVRKPTPPKERQEKSATKSISEMKSESSNISDIRKKTQNCIQPMTKSPSPVTKPKNDKNSCSVEKSTSTIDVRSQSKTAVKNLVVKTKSSTSSEHRKRLSSPLSALDESLTKKQQDSVKRLSQVTSLELKEVSSLSSKTSNQIHSKSTLKILMEELEYILLDDAHDITATVDIFSRQKSLPKISPKDTHEKSATSEEELIKLAELEKILMGIKDLSVLQKAVKLILSSGYFLINDELDSELSALSLNLIRELQNFVATKI